MVEQRAYWVVLFGIVLAVSGCADEVVTEPPPTTPSYSATPAAEGALQHVARGIAMALDREDVRFTLRDAMRDARFAVG